MTDSSALALPADDPHSAVPRKTRMRHALYQSKALKRLYRLRREHPSLANQLDALAADINELIDVLEGC